VAGTGQFALDSQVSVSPVVVRYGVTYVFARHPTSPPSSWLRTGLRGRQESSDNYNRPPDAREKRGLTRKKSVPTHSFVTGHPSLIECGDCLCLASRRAARALARAFDRQLRPLGIRATQFSILTMLLLRRPLTIGELAEFLGIDRTTLTRNLALVESKGWVDIRPGNDARSRVVAATQKGRAAVMAAMPAWRKAQQGASAAIGRGGVDALHALARSV
jgi:DNA-binding MarR family transcriptional regulator